MLFESPRETRRVVFVMTRSGIKDECFHPEEVSVMVRFDNAKPEDAPSWMEVNDALESTHLVIVTHEDPEDFNADLAKIVMEYGPKGIAGELRTQDMEVVDVPARSRMVGTQSELCGTIRAIHRDQIGD